MPFPIRHAARAPAGVLASLLLGACTWVQVTETGAEVRVAEESEVTACERLGRTTVSGVDRILAAKRLEHVVQREMQDMARNEAANIGGNAVVAVSPIENGKQTFAVFSCP